MKEQFKPTVKVEEKIEASIEQVTPFGELLVESRKNINKSRKEIGKELGISSEVLLAWENTNYFPEDKYKEDFPTIAKAYGIELDVFTKTLEISRVARRLEIQAKRDPKPNRVKISRDNEIYGPGAARRTGSRGTSGSY